MTSDTHISARATPTFRPTHLHNLAHWAAQSPDKAAYIFLNGRLKVEDSVTFLDLKTRVEHVAQSISEKTEPGARALILLPSGIDYIVAFLGCLAAGVVAVPYFPPTGGLFWKKLRTIAGDCTPDLLITPKAIVERCAAAFESFHKDMPTAQIVSFEALTKEAAPHSFLTQNIQTDDLAFLQYTSGSTGQPKGVMITHRNLVHNAYWQSIDTGNNAQSVTVSWLPLYHDMGLIGKILQSLSLGSTTVFMSPTSFLKRPLNWLKAISDYKGTISGGPNFAYDYCVDKISDEELASLDLSHWQTAYNGSEPIRISTVERFTQRFAKAGFQRSAFYPSYGMAEATLYIAGGPAKSDPLNLPFPLDSKKSQDAATASLCPSVFKPFKGMCTRIINPESWKACQVGTIGEIWLSGESVGTGYWNKPEETAETFHAFTSDTGEGPFLRTGDLGFFHDEKLCVTGRIKDLIINNGVNHYPADIEETVQSISPAFRRHAGAAFEDDTGALVIVQAIEPKQKEASDLKALSRRAASKVFQDHSLSPAFICLVKAGEIEKTSSGKIKRAKMRKRFLSDELTVVFRWAPTTALTTARADQTNRSKDKIEAFLKHWIANKCGLEISELDNRLEFVGYGLGSVDAVDMTQALSSQFALEIDAADVFNYPNIAALSQHVAAS